ncbi:hypothetical protein LWM68_21095 [Niabella sp. W65]|nr:hypothetical protein [Niabella sp. W65]MCH7365033.1 hypothetical protein [Niabella sp. W65]ULT40847.1 hypothetical protein KRR40_39975 [Niabella sp. I65]
MLKISKGTGNYKRRQDAPKVYAIDGAMYIINTSSLLSNSSFADFACKRKILNSHTYNIDLDTLDDWNFAEYLIKYNLIEKQG